MRKLNFLNLLVVLAVLVMIVAAVIPAFAMPPAAVGPDAVIKWNGIAQRTIVQVAGQSPSHAVISMAYAQAAVYDAVVAIEGGYTPYAKKIKQNPNASVDAAVAAAAYGVLVHYFPNQQAALNADYAASLAAVPDGPAKTAGVAIGKEAADALINQRKSDGYMDSINLKLPEPGPGNFQLLPNQTALIPWLSKMKPFLLESKDQVRPAGPTPLSSAEWAEDYNEVKEIGRLVSTTRTAEQTDAARFFTAHAVPMYNNVYKTIIQNQNLNAVEAARFYAMGYLVVADANIACYDAKYKFMFWRPQTAIQQGDTDGNPYTAGDPTWTPLIPTPPHPEYTSGHGCFTASTAEVFANVMGTRNFNFTLTSNAPNVVNTTRAYSSVDQLIEDIIDVRVWSGIHFRHSDVDGVNIGTDVADWALDRYFLPAD